MEVYYVYNGLKGFKGWLGMRGIDDDDTGSGVKGLGLNE